MGFLNRILSLLSLLIYIVLVPGGTSSDFSYHDVKEWPSISPACGGQRQSPIAFDRQLVKDLKGDCPVVKPVNYDNPPDSFELKNVGHSVLVSGKWSKYSPFIEVNNEVASGSYRFAQFHLHWAEGDYNGSEHTIASAGTTVELHAVHLNNKYSDEDAFKASDGLLVFSRPFLIDDGPGELDTLNEPLAKVQEVGSSTSVPASSLFDFGIQCKQSFLSYPGSLTTPPCTENVSWFFCTYPGLISRPTIDALRQIQLLHGDTNNVRPIQELNGRTVYLLQCKKKRKGKKN